MKNKNQNIDAETLRIWLEEAQPVLVLDVRPKDQREEWKIPGSVYLDAYQRLNAGDTSVLDEISIPQNTKVITVCAAGRTSAIASNELRKKGIEAYSLEGGMKGWTLAWNVAELEDGELKIVQLRRTGKGCLSYMIGSGDEAIVIDASLDAEVYKKIATEKGWKIKYVLDTHIHADHLSRSLDLSIKSGAMIYMPDQDKLEYEFHKIKENDVMQFGSSGLKAISTPGHTSESMTYVVNNKYLFTGDTLFTDGVGRPDLKATEKEVKKRAALLYYSLQLLIQFDGSSLVLPGHISKPVPFDHQIIASSLNELKENVAALSLSENDFVKNILSKIPPTPPNYLRVVELNLLGDLKNVDPKEVEAGANRCAIS